MMVRIWLLVLISCALLTPVNAAEIKETSRITAVTVYPSGARITRVAKVKMTKGSHVIALDDLAAQAMPGSIRVEGRATGQLEIGSVDSRRVNIATTDAAVIASERKRIEDQIEALRDQSAVIGAETEAAQTQMTLLRNLAQLPVRPAGAALTGAPTAGEDWGNILSLIGVRMGAAQKVLLANKIKQREILRQIKNLEGKLASVAPNQKIRTSIKVHVVAASNLEAELKIQYQVRRASWRPLYDARLATGGKSVVPALMLVRRATIKQRTGEAWDDIKLELSTSQPAAGTAAPELYQLSVDFWQRPPPTPRPTAMSAPQRSRSFRRGKKEMVQNEADYSMADGLAQKVSVKQRRAKVKAAQFQAVFEVPGLQTIGQTGEAKKVVLDQTTLEPSLLVRTVPKRRATAYLYAKFKLPKGTPYLPGQVQLFRDSTFVGSGHLPLLRPGQDHELGFGGDDAVLVKFAVLEEKRGETGLISSSKTDKRNYRITVRNLHERAIKLSVLDQIPVSKNQDIRVDLNAKTPPTKRDVKDKRGVLAWEKTMRSGEKVVIEFGYRITWPSGKQIRYGR